ncbi:MAG: stage V sporulation protein AD [Oscillospiraceae bacterium]|nr:stage V sporulation protein AD [Oscillospiraceae bacterium]
MGRIITLKKPVAITTHSCVGGKKEGQGPLGEYFDIISEDNYFGQESWEKAETEMLKRSFYTILKKRDIKPQDIDVALGGDLCNQITSTAFCYRDIPVPFLGLYGACSAMAESMVIGACLINSGGVDNALCSASSHFATAERQFRTPLDYGGKRTPTAQWTVTGAAHALLEREGKGPFITRVMFGRIADLGIKDANNMGAAMAPAAATTLKEFFTLSGEKVENYDAIYTGDLGQVGTDLLKQLLMHENIELTNHKDCGLIIFDRESQQVQAGASGCGCSGCVLSSHILPQLEAGNLHRILFMATGALLSPTTTMQQESIPGIAHLVEIVAEKE